MPKRRQGGEAHQAAVPCAPCQARWSEHCQRSGSPSRSHKRDTAARGAAHASWQGAEYRRLRRRHATPESDRGSEKRVRHGPAGRCGVARHADQRAVRLSGCRGMRKIGRGAPGPRSPQARSAARKPDFVLQVKSAADVRNSSERSCPNASNISLKASGDRLQVSK